MIPNIISILQRDKIFKTKIVQEKKVSEDYYTRGKGGKYWTNYIDLLHSMFKMTLTKMTLTIMMMNGMDTTLSNRDLHITEIYKRII